ncbi:MAG: rhodanese-like domain-containing protein [Desulfonatronovibrio sp.]
MVRQQDFCGGYNKQVVEDLERQAYQLNILNESIRELTLLEDPDQILKKFVLLILGAMGSARGFVLKLGNYGQSVELESRGLSLEENRNLRQSGPDLFNKFFSHLSVQNEVLPKQVRLVRVNDSTAPAEQETRWPRQTRFLIQWTLSSDCYGFAGLGAKINGKDFSDADKDFLSSMTEVFMDSLKLARSTRQVRELNDNLMIKNQQLTTALNSARKTQLDLDRHVFHFKALSEMSRELSGIFNKEKLLSSFLLMAQGTLSARSGFILLFDVPEDSFLSSRRGDRTKELHKIDQSRVKDFILSFYPAQSCFSLSEYKVQALRPNHLSALSFDLPLEIGVVFSLDENYFGIMGFCSKITGGEFSRDEEDLLSSLTMSFLVSLENVLSFEIIQKLNLDLGHRNYELSKTIEELRQTRDRVNVLQKTRNRISSLISKELLRLERVNVLDFVLIFVLTLVLSLTYNLSSPGGISPVPETWTFTAPPSIETDWAALKHKNKSAVFVDARPNEFYSQERIAGAIGLPLNLFDFVYMMKFSKLDPQKDIIVYGRNISRRYDEKVAHELTQRGHLNVHVLPGGLAEWKRLDLPVEP